MTQLSAVTGRRIKPNYVDIINQQAAQLPALYGLRSQKAHQDRMYDLEVKSMEDAEAAAKRQEALYEEELDQRKKQARQAQALGWANAGIGGLRGLGQIYNAFDDDPAKPSSEVLRAAGVGGIGTPAYSGIKDAGKAIDQWAYSSPYSTSAATDAAAQLAFDYGDLASSAYEPSASGDYLMESTGSGLGDIFEVGKKLWDWIF